MIKLRIPAAVLAVTLAGYAGSALAQQSAPTSDPSAQTTTQAPTTQAPLGGPSSSTAPSYGSDPAATTPSAPQADSAASSGTPSSATAADPAPGDTAAPAPSTTGKKTKAHKKPAGAEAPGSASPDTPK